MRREQKKEVIDGLKEEFAKTDTAALVDYRGLDCEQMTKLRCELKSTSAELKVVKNTLLKIASEGTSFEQLNDFYQGPTAITFIREDPVDAAKVLMKYVKEFKTLEIKSGLLQGKFLDAASFAELSKLPSREILLSQLLSVMNGPIRGFATVLSGVPRGFVTVLSALRDQKEG